LAPLRAATLSLNSNLLFGDITPLGNL